MNNINLKNTIFSLNSNSELPYSSIEYVNHATGRELNSHYVNTSLYLLLDNDLYIENMLQAASAYMTGPKAYDEYTISSKPNGYKTYGLLDTADCLDIWRKEEKPLSASIAKVGNVAGSVNFICLYGDIVIVGTNQKLWYKDIKDGQNIIDGSSWTQLLGKATNNYWMDSSRVFFGASDGVYQLSSYINLDSSGSNPDYGKKMYAAVKLNSNNIGNITAVAYSKRHRMIVAAAGSGITLVGGYYLDQGAKVFVANYSPALDFSASVGKVKFSEASLYSWNGPRCSLVTRNHVFDADVSPSSGKLLIGTQDGLYTEYNKEALKDYKQIIPANSGSSVTCNGIVQFNNVIYAYTSNGIFKIDLAASLVETRVLASITGNIVDIYVDDVEKAMYIAKSDKIYRVNQALNIIDISLKLLKPSPLFSTGASICRLQRYRDGNIVVALNHSTPSNRGCYYFKYDDTAFCINKILHASLSIANSIVDICVVGNGILVADSTKVYILKNISSSNVPSGYIKSLSLHSVGRKHIVKLTLKMLTLHNESYSAAKTVAVMEDCITDMSNGNEIPLNCTAADCLMTLINGIDAIILATDAGAKICTYNSIAGIKVETLDSTIISHIFIGRVFELANSFVFTNVSYALIMPKTVNSHTTNRVDGSFYKPAVTNNILYGINGSSTTNNVLAYQEYTDPIKDTGSLANSHVCNIDFCCEDSKAIAVKAVDGKLYAEMLSVVAVQNDGQISVLSSNTIANSGINYGTIKNFGNDVLVMLASNGSKTTISVSKDYPNEESLSLSSKYGLLVTTSNIYDICDKPTYDTAKYEGNGIESLFMACSNGLWVYSPTYSLTNAYVQHSKTTKNAFGVACLYVDDPDDAAIDGHTYGIDAYETVMLSGAVFEFDNPNVQMMTAHRFSYAYVKNGTVHDNISVIYLDFKSSGGTAPFTPNILTTCNLPGILKDAFNYFNEFISWNDANSLFYTAYFMTNDTIYRKSNDLSLIIKGTVTDYKYTPGTTFTVEANNTNTLINGHSDIDVASFINGDVSYGRNPYVMAACNLRKGATTSNDCLLFYKIRNNANAGDIGHFINNGSSIVARMINVRSITDNGSYILASGESIEKAYFYAGPDVRKDVTRHNEDSWTDPIEWTVDSPVMQGGTYTICIKTNIKVFTIDVTFSSNGGNFTNAVYVDNSYDVIYSNLNGLTYFCKKSILSNKYDHIMAVINGAVVNVVLNTLIYRMNSGIFLIKDVFPMRGLFEEDAYTYYLLTNAGSKIVSRTPNYLTSAVKCGNYNAHSNTAALSVFYCNQTNTLFFIMFGELFAVTNGQTNDLNELVTSISIINVGQYYQNTYCNGSRIGSFIGCYADANYVYCYKNDVSNGRKHVFRFNYNTGLLSATVKNIIVDGTGILFRDLGASTALIERMLPNIDLYELYDPNDTTNSQGFNPFGVYIENTNINDNVVFFAPASIKGVWYFNNSYLLRNITNTTNIKSAYYLFSAGNRLGALNGNYSYLENTPNGTVASYNLGFGSITDCFYDNIYGQLFVYKEGTNGTKETYYGDGIQASTKINFNSAINSIALEGNLKYACTDIGVYKVDSYMNPMLDISAVTTLSKNVISLNSTGGSKAGIVQKGDLANSPLKISLYNINSDAWEDILFYTMITSYGKNSKNEITATNTHKINVYPVSAFYSNKNGNSTIFCLLSAGSVVDASIRQQIKASTYHNDNFDVDTNCLCDVNYGTKLLNSYRDVSFKEFFPNATSFNLFNGHTFVCNGEEIDTFSGYGLLTCFMCVDGTNTYSISGFMNGKNNDLVLNTSNGICIYNDKDNLVQGKNIAATAVGRWMPDGNNYKYLCTVGNLLYQSDNYRIWKPLFLLKCAGSNISDVRSICVIDSKTYCFANPNGLYCTKYLFSMVKDVKAFTLAEALSLYEELMRLPATGISALVSNTISTHIDTEHCYEKDYIFLKNKDKFLDSTSLAELKTKVASAYAAAGISTASGKPKEITDKLNSFSTLQAALLYIVQLAQKEQNGTSLISHLNNDYIDIKMEDIDIGWQQSSGANNDLVIKNDIVSEIYFGRWLDGDVVVLISNYLTPVDEDEDLTEISTLTYIMKRWMSGMTELFINIPTTNTYYLANTYGAADCTRNEDDAYLRPNLYEFSESLLTQSSKISEHYTSISVGIASCEYHIDNLLGVQINGNSLPLKIYKDGTATTSIASNMYRSMSEPSLLKSYDLLHTDEDGNYIFNFAAFGSDAQAVMLQFYDSKARSNLPWIRVVFDPNGGEGEMPKQKFLINEDGSLEQKTLKGNKFTNKQGDTVKIFNGWTISPQPENYSDWDGEHYDGTQVYSSDGPNLNKGIVWPHGTTKAALFTELARSLEEPFEKKEEITLYASWITYLFSESDTTILMNSDMSLFNIANVGLSTNTKLKDNVVINFGD